MPALTMDVGVVLERRKATSPWLDVIWRRMPCCRNPRPPSPGR